MNNKQNIYLDDSVAFVHAAYQEKKNTRKPVLSDITDDSAEHWIGETPIS